MGFKLPVLYDTPAQVLNDLPKNALPMLFGLARLADLQARSCCIRINLPNLTGQLLVSNSNEAVAEAFCVALVSWFN